MRDRDCRILVIDPDPLFAHKVRTLLSAEGYEVETAEGTTAAARVLREVCVDCMIVDEDLPEMKGHDAIPVLRAIAPQAAFIMTAPRNTRATESMIRRQDVLFYHLKCFDVHEICTAVNDAFRKIGKKPTGPRRAA